ncbi:hypothetical protein ACOMHN_065813 [Nucella lapillus]
MHIEKETMKQMDFHDDGDGDGGMDFHDDGDGDGGMDFPDDGDGDGGMDFPDDGDGDGDGGMSFLASFSLFCSIPLMGKSNPLLDLSFHLLVGGR